MTSPDRRVLRRFVAPLLVVALAGCGQIPVAERPGAPTASAVAPTQTAAPTRTTGPTQTAGPTHPSASASTSAGGPGAGETPTGGATDPTGPPPSRPPSSQHSTSKPPTRKPSRSDPPSGGPRYGDGPGGSITRLPTDEVALTFDDGPSASLTPQMLDLLAAHHVKATFCVIGKNVEANPSLVRRIVAEGHTLCNHSWRHALDLATWTDAQIRADLERTNAAIRAAAPGAKISYFRAPGGNFDERLVSIAASLGLQPLFWQVDTRDWDDTTHGTGKKMVQWITQRVQADTVPGSIVLAHDIHPDTITAFTKLLPGLKHRFTLVPLPPDGI